MSDDELGVPAMTAALMVEMIEGYGPIREAMEGYRLQLVGDGYPDDLARVAAIQMHGLAIETIRAGIRTQYSSEPA